MAIIATIKTKPRSSLFIWRPRTSIQCSRPRQHEREMEMQIQMINNYDCFHALIISFPHHKQKSLDHSTTNSTQVTSSPPPPSSTSNSASVKYSYLSTNHEDQPVRAFGIRRISKSVSIQNLSPLRKPGWRPDPHHRRGWGRSRWISLCGSALEYPGGTFLRR